MVPRPPASANSPDSPGGRPSGLFELFTKTISDTLEEPRHESANVRKRKSSGR